MTLWFWQRGSRPSHQEALPLALWTLASVISAWTRPPPPWQAPSPRAPLLRFRAVEEHHTAPGPGLLSRKTRVTPAADILGSTLALWAAATLLRTCYRPPPHLLQSRLLSEDIKFHVTPKMRRSLQCIIEVVLCTPQPRHTVPMSHRATLRTQMLAGQGHTWPTTRCLHHPSPPNMISPQCRTGTVTETQACATAQGASVPGGHLTTTSRTQTLLQNTTPIILITTQIAGTTGGTGETAWAPGRATTATRDTAITTILTTTTAAAAAEGAATTETGTEIEIETVTTPTAPIPDTILTLTALPPTACLPHPPLTLRSPPPKSLPQPLLRDWTFPPDKGARPSQRGALCLLWVLTKTIMQVTMVLCLHLHHPHRPSHRPLLLQRL